MGKRSRRRSREHDEPVATSSYTDSEGGVLELRDSLSAGTLRQLAELPASPAASAEDRSARRTEFLFERLAVRWTIAGLPLEGQKELLGRYRMADSVTRSWVSKTLEDHLRERHPESLP